MDILADPLRDSLNPPPRYQLESDSEDEIGEGIYGSTKIPKPSSPPRPPATFKLNGHIDSLIGKPTVIGIGTAGSQFGRALPAFKDSQGASIETDDYQIGTAYCISASQLYIHISSKIPSPMLWPLSRWLLETFKPTRLAIIDVYPVPTYITLSSASHLSPPIRYLETSTPGLALNSTQPKRARAGSIEAVFSPPNLLGTQTLSSALLPCAQVSLLSGSSSLKEEATLTLLPWPRSSVPAPKTLDEDALHEGLTSLEDDVWSAEELATAADAVGVEGVSFGSQERASQRTKRTAAAQDGMYL